MTYLHDSLDEIGSGARFEGFSKSFLKKIGLTLLKGPAIGPDGGKDLIMAERFLGRLGNEIDYKWLISAKFRSQGRSVSPSDEQMIIERLQRHNCNGFIGLYSSSPSQNLADYFEGLQGTQVAQIHMFDLVIFDGNDIIEMLKGDPRRFASVIKTYLPSLHAKLISEKSDDNFNIEQRV